MHMMPYTAAYWGSSLLHKCVVMSVVITDIAEWIIQQDCRHMCSETLPTPMPLQLSSLLFTPAWTHPSNILLLLQLLWAWICHTHLYFMYLYSISAKLLHQTSSQENVCVKVRQTSDLSQAGFMVVFSLNWNTHMNRWASHRHTHHLSQTGTLLWDANDIQMYSVQCCASCSQRMLCPYMD